MKWKTPQIDPLLLGSVGCGVVVFLMWLLLWRT